MHGIAQCLAAPAFGGVGVSGADHFYAALNHWSPSVLRSILMIGLFIVARWRSIPLGWSATAGTQHADHHRHQSRAVVPYRPATILPLHRGDSARIAQGGVDQGKRLTSGQDPAVLNRTLDLLVLNVVVGLAVLPVTLYYFGTASLNGIMGNLLGIPLTGGLLVLGFLILFLPGGNLLSTAFVSSYALILRVFEGWMEWVASLPFILQNTWLIIGS